MMPLCTTRNWPVQSECGWAFRVVGLPWVAQRVCPMPVHPLRDPSSDARYQSSQLAGLFLHHGPA